MLLRKKRLQKPPTLHLLDNKGWFDLYSGIREFATGSTLYQRQSGKPKLMSCAKKECLKLWGIIPY